MAASARPRWRSLRGDTPVEMKVVNNTDSAITTWWIDYEGNEIKYAETAPGEEFHISTYVTHPWIFREAVTSDQFVVDGHLVFFPTEERRIAHVRRPKILDWGLASHKSFPLESQKPLQDLLRLYWSAYCNTGDIQDEPPISAGSAPQSRLSAMLIETIKRMQEDLKIQSLYFREYKFSDLENATNNFDKDRLKGEGGYGQVYMGHMHHMPVAIKILSEGGLQGREQFTKEVDVLSRIRHPHIVALLGACSERFCLVYEYMANGSLEDRLNCSSEQTPPLAWHARIRIITEVAQGLLHLHSNHPEPIIHRDLKPANILLDHNLVSKIGDVGLAKFAPGLAPGHGTSGSPVNTYLMVSSPVGTFAYIDPEYLHTGKLGLKSDLYALGKIMLQLLTGKSAQDSVLLVRTGIENGDLHRILDSSAGEWNMDIAKTFAELGLACASFERRQRPDLEGRVLPALQHMWKTAHELAEAEAGTGRLIHTFPEAFICPITQELMEDPVVAADGHTYERAAISEWLESHQTSPMTNLWLSHKELVPNHALRSAVQEAKQNRQ